MRSAATCLAFSVLLVVVATAPCFAEKTVVMAFSEFPPYKMFIDGKESGIDVELAQRIADEMGFTLEFKDCDLNECLDLMREGEVDIMTSLLKRPEREAFIEYVQPRYYSHNIKAFYVAAAAKHPIVQYGDLKGLRIGIKEGAKYVPMFDEDDTLTKVEVATTPQLLRMLLDGKLDTVLLNAAGAAFWIKAMDMEKKIVRSGFAFEQLDPVYMGISKKSPMVKQAGKFGRVLKSLIGKGVVEQLREEYMKRAAELADQLQ